MANIKIFLEDGETELSALLNLQKALAMHDEGLVHDHDRYSDVAMESTKNYLEALYEEFFEDLLQDILDILRN